MKIRGKDMKIEGRLVRIARMDGDKYNFPDDPEAFLNDLRKCGTRIDLFTFLEKLPVTSPKYRYAMEWDNLAVLPVSTFDDWWNKQIDPKTRNMVRKAEKKMVTLREVPFGDDLIQGICGIYNETPIRQGKKFPHFGMSIEKGREYAGTFLDRSIYVGAFFGDTMIGFIKLVTDESRTQACLIHILSMVQHKDKAPTNALIAHAVRACADRGIRYLVYEHFSYGKKRRDNLSDFKANNGFKRVELPRYYVPLNVIGRIAFRLGLHGKLADHIPESVASKLRDLRKAFHRRQLASVKES